MPSLRQCFPGTMSAQPGPIFVVCLQAQKGVEPIRALRRALKTLKRRYGLRCVTIREARKRAFYECH